MVERNTLRCYLALQSHVKTRGAPGSNALQQSLELWFGATERHAEQLHEMERADSATMKLKEVKRQEAMAPPPG